MNLAHRIICRSAVWQRKLEGEVFPWVFDGVALGEDVLEIGPGPGLTTDLLRRRVRHLTAIEADPALAGQLRSRLGEEIAVVAEDATAMPFPDASFDGAVCLTMLHHVPSRQLQDRLLAEAARVLRPGGVFAGCDSLSSGKFRLLHLFDTCVPVDPQGFSARLEAAGFSGIQVEANHRAFRFCAWKPEAASA